MNKNVNTQIGNISFHDTQAVNGESFELFAEELHDQHDNSIPGLCCLSSLSSVGGCWGSLSSLSSGC